MSAVTQNRKERAQTAAAQRKADKLDYIRQMLRELRDMTAAEDEAFIAYLINMAYFATGDLIRTRYANLILATPAKNNED